MKRGGRFVRMLLALVSVPVAGTVLADAVPQFEIEIRDHLYNPAEIEVPANRKVRLLVINRDDTPEEFESYELNREKVIMGGARATIYIGPLAPGEYPFFGEFNPKTAQGKVIAIEKP